MTGHWTHTDTMRWYWKLARAIGLRGALDYRRAKKSDDVSIRTKWTDYPVFVRRQTSDFLVFDQIFIDREYRCIDDLEAVSVIVDAGANVGYSSAYLLSKFPAAKVIAIEPDPENFKALQRNLAPWGNRATLLHAALWSKPDILNFSQDSPGAGAWGRKVQSDGTGNIEAIDISYLLCKFGLSQIDLLKIDIEGAEREVFASASWLDHVRNIVIELHGSEEARIFAAAIRGRNYAISHCDELTVCQTLD